MTLILLKSVWVFSWVVLSFVEAYLSVVRNFKCSTMTKWNFNYKII